LSHQATGWVLEFSDSRLGARLVLLELAYRMNNDSEICYPSLETIARECRMSKQGVIQAIENLEKLGELSVDRTEKPGSGSVNQYSMPLFSEWWEEARKIAIKGKKGQLNTQERVNPITERVNPIEEKGQWGLPEQLEQSEEPSRNESQVDLPALWKEMRRIWKRKVGGRSLGSSLRGSYGEKFIELAQKHGAEKVFAGFEEFIESKGRDYLRTLRFPISQFINDAEVFIDDASIQVEEPKPEQVAGPRGVSKRYANL